MSDHADVVQRFATALDVEDYATAASLLDGRCIYACRGVEHRGPDAIVASYRDNGTAAKRFDRIDYESAVVAETPHRFRIRFADHIVHAGERCTFRCEQIVEIGDHGRIARIEHVDLDGQTEALAAFRKRVGA